MVLTGTSLLLLGLLGTTTALVTAYAGEKAGEALDKAIKKNNSTSKFSELMQEKRNEIFEQAKADALKEIEKGREESLKDRGSALGEQKKEENKNKNEEPKKDPVLVPPGTLPGTGQEQEQSQMVKDETMTNVESLLNGNDLQQYLEKMRDEQWAREDKIRQETQAREDTAYQRAVQDMQKAGINPNLMNVSPAESGGGITNATGIDYSVYEGEIEKAIKQFETAINNAFKEGENEKDRITDIIQTGIFLAGMFLKKSKK